MEPTVQLLPDRQQVRILDEQGRVIGVIQRPIASDLLGPGREKVYLSRRTAQADRTPHAA